MIKNRMTPSHDVGEPIDSSERGGVFQRFSKQLTQPMAKLSTFGDYILTPPKFNIAPEEMMVGRLLCDPFGRLFMTSNYRG